MIIKLAWRNIWRNWRRSLITILAIVFATFLTIFQKGIQDGTYGHNIKLSIEMFTGYLQIQHKDFSDNPSLRKSIRYDQKLVDILKENKKIRGFAPRIMTNGLLGFKDNSLGTALIAVDPEQETRVSILKEKVKGGAFLTKSGKYDILLGYKMLENIGAKLGDTVVVLTSAYDGSMGNLKFRIAGLTKLGSNEFDGMSAFIGLEAAQELLSMEGKVTGIAIKLDGLNDMLPVQNELKRSLKDIGPESAKLGVLNWEELLPELKQSMEMDNSSNMIYMLFLILIVAFGILNTLLMSITERFREFGVMLALGTKQFTILRILIIETLMIALIGILLGNVLGFCFNYYILLHPIQLGGQYGAIYEEFGFVPALYSLVEPYIFLNTSLLIIFISVMAFVYPAYRVLKLEALKGIRYT